MKQTFLQALHKYNIKPTQKTLSSLLNEPDRFKNFSANTGDLLLDFSRTGLDQQTLSQLLALAEECGVEEARKRLFSGQNINFTENRPALHMAMRSDDVLAVLDDAMVRRVKETRQRMSEFASAFAALKCRELGGRAGIPCLKEVEALLSSRDDGNNE